MLWDEENRLQGVNDNGLVSQYTYDDSGERVIKSSGGTESMFVNGANIGSFGHEKNYTAYLNPYFVFKEGSFTKHYYIGAQRIVSKIGNGRFDNNSGLNGNGITAGGINFAKQQSWYDKKVEEYIASLGIPPGPPDKKGIYGSPEYTGQPYPDFGSPLNENNEPPLGWPKVPVFNQPGDVPGPPIKWGDPVTNDNVEAGWGYEGTGVIEENDQYFYHPDHLGSTSYVTTRLGKVSQHVEYIPFGEVFLEEKNDKWNTPYKFNAKEFDEETGLGYFGARYFDSKLSLFYSVDPATEMTMTPYQFSYQNPIKYTDPTGMVPEGPPTKEEAAAMSAHVYGDKKDDILIGGWKVSNRNFGKGVKLNDEETGLKSQIYERTVDGKTEYTYATAGTEDIKKDGVADVLQAFGASKQHSQSAKNAIEIHNQLKATGEELTFTGHSLGGGLAALNSNLTRNKAITFNAAGVGKLTKYNEGGIIAALRTEGLIKAYIMTTDPLNIVQNNNTLLSPGYFMPDVNGKRHYIKATHASSKYNGHSINTILREFKIDPDKYAK
jgi:RHS repeat-associated protein